MSAPSSESLRALRDKYERMLALRVLHARARADASFVEPDPRAAMAALADEFPGALRELDRLEEATIVARIAALARAEQDPATAEEWMHAQALFHRLARGALVTKRWLGGARSVDASTARAFAAAVASLRWAGDAALFAAALERIARPPRGRVMDVVHEMTAERLGLTVREVRRLVFG